jgi:hypothetical protein
MGSDIVMMKQYSRWKGPHYALDRKLGGP